MAEEEARKTTFRGTPLECEAWLRRFFDIMRIFLGNEDESSLELFERTAWDIDIVAVDGVLKDRVRKDLRSYCDMISLERELFELLAKTDEDKDNVDSDTISEEQEADNQED